MSSARGEAGSRSAPPLSGLALLNGFAAMAEAGIEPARRCDLPGILSPVRLPVSPLGRLAESYPVLPGFQQPWWRAGETGLHFHVPCLLLPDMHEP